jgi:hypothetical protein
MYRYGARITLIMLIGFSLGFAVWFVKSNAKSQQQHRNVVFGTANSENLTVSNDPTVAQGRISIPVVTDQLGLVDGVIPVELKCENAELSAPNVLENLSCVIKNNTNKPISAGAVYTSIIPEKDGIRSVSSS